MVDYQDNFDLCPASSIRFDWHKDFNRLLSLPFCLTTVMLVIFAPVLVYLVFI